MLDMINHMQTSLAQCLNNQSLMINHLINIYYTVKVVQITTNYSKISSTRIQQNTPNINKPTWLYC